MKTLRIVAIPILFAFLPVQSRAADVQVTTSTQNPWYRDYLSDNKGLSDVSQYLRLSASRLDDEGKFNLYGYGRILGQFSSASEGRQQLGFPLENDVVGRLYYLYLDYRDVVKDRLDLRAGRAYVPTAALAATVDGLNLNFKNLAIMGPVGLGASAFGGRRVTFDAKGEIGNGNDSLWGGSLYVDTIKFTRFEASYARMLTDGALAQEIVALDLSSSPFKAVNLNGRLKYDIVSSRYSEAQGSVSVAPFAALVLRGEFYSSYPSFDKFSFYRFFNVNHFQQLSGAAEYQLFSNLRLSARYAHERFDDNATADSIETGVSARPVRNLTLNVSYEARSGFAGRLGGVRAAASYRIQKATLLAGVDYDDFRREASRDGSAKKYYAGLGYDFTRKFSAVARLEDNSNFHSDNLFQGFLAFNVNL